MCSIKYDAMAYKLSAIKTFSYFPKIKNGVPGIVEKMILKFLFQLLFIPTTDDRFRPKIRYFWGKNVEKVFTSSRLI